jgi:CubicO group peptidase (beta-lactamase class C family)
MGTMELGRGSRTRRAIVVAPCLLAAACGRATPPSPPAGTAPLAGSDGWRTAQPQDVGIDPAPLREMVGRVLDRTYPDIHGILIVKDGALVFERYFPGYAWDYQADGFRGPWTEHGPDTPHNLASVTKSVTGILLAIAIDKGYVKGVEEPLCPFFPEHAASCVGGKERITLRHVLTMSSGLAWNEQDVPYSDPRNDIVQLFVVADPVGYILSKAPAHEPGTRWYYNGGGTNLLGKVIEKASGSRLDAFAEEHLFGPLGMSGEEWVFIRPDLVYASGDMKMRPRDMAKLGQLLLDHGAWGGRAVLSPAWADDVVRKRVRHTETSGYGYHWWLRTYSSGSTTIDAFLADGWGGQRIMGFPSLRLVVVFTGGNYTGQHRLDEVVTRFVLPAASAAPR